MNKKETKEFDSKLVEPKSQYFYLLPRFESMPSNEQNGKSKYYFNNENPLKRLRKHVNPNINDDNERDNTFGKVPIPSSYIPSIYFENTVPHPYLIFYNLHLRDLHTKNGYHDEEPSESIIAQLNKYFEVQDILSFAFFKNDCFKISETWNNRFPDAKSFSFSPIRDDIKIVDLHDIQSLHLLGFQLNATFFLIFKIGQDGKDENIRYYNMKLGPDSSDFDIHFLVLEHVDKSEEHNSSEDGQSIINYKHDLWLSLQLIEIGLEDKSNLPDSIFANEYSGITFLEMEKRNPIPIIHIPSFSKYQFDQVTWTCQNTIKDEGHVLFRKDNVNKNFKIIVSASQKYINKINKMKSIVTKIKKQTENKKYKNRINHSFDDYKCFFAYMNRSAFLVTEQDIKNEDLYNKLNRHFAIDTDKHNENVIQFAAKNQTSITNAINNCIIVNDCLMGDNQTTNENAKSATLPIQKQTFIKSNKQILDHSFDFVDENKLFEAISNSDTAELDFHIPKYLYQFYAISKDKIIDFISFTIKSYYQLKYIYVSCGKVFSVGVSGDAEFVYGTCEALDTEMRFKNPIKGKFIDAVYLEEISCLIICYYANKEYCFTGYDYKGQINDCKIDSKNVTVKSLIAISKTYFASSDGKSYFNFEGFCVFNYSPIERKVEFHEYSENWRITESNYVRSELFRQYLHNEANKNDSNYKPSFIGSQFSYGYNTSTFCIYKYDSVKKCLIKEYDISNKNQPKLNMSFEQGFTSSNDEENNLLEKRIEKGSKDIIKSMQNLLPLKENYQSNKSSKKDKRKSNKEIHFSDFDIQCSLCELFPTPVVINNKIITRTSDNNLSFYSCDYKIYRVLSDQIYGFYINTISRISLFAWEDILSQYEFPEIYITLIVDTCGIGAKFSNMFFGTRFDEMDILSEDIWSGFSYSGSLATIVLLFRVSDTESIYNAVKPHIILDDSKETYAEKKEINPTIFFCKKAGVRYSIRLGFSPEIILSKTDPQSNEITFIDNNEFMSQANHLRNDFYDFSGIGDTDQLPNIINDSRKALKIAKMIITRYLSFHTFNHYPLETIEKYSMDVKPYIYNIGVFQNYKTYENYLEGNSDAKSDIHTSSTDERKNKKEISDIEDKRIGEVELDRNDFYRLFKITDQKGQIFAGEIFYQNIECYSKKCQKKVIKYFEKMIQIEHPSILKCISYKIDARLTLFTQFVHQMPLQNIIPKLNDTQKLIIIFGIASAMLYLHSHGILHQDLTIENVYVDQNFYPKLSNIGMRTVFKSIKSMQKVPYLPFYQAPELYIKNKYNKKSEVYSFGLIVYEICTNSRAFDDVTFIQHLDDIKNKRRPPIPNQEISSSYSKLIEDCLSQNPRKRPSFLKIVYEMKKENSEFITEKVDFNEFKKYVCIFDLLAQPPNETYEESEEKKTKRPIRKPKEEEEEEEEEEENNEDKEIVKEEEEEEEEEKNEDKEIVKEEEEEEFDENDYDYDLGSEEEEKLDETEKGICDKLKSENVNRIDIKQYKRIKEIGQGSFGIVYKTKKRIEERNKTKNEIFAAKVFNIKDQLNEHEPKFVNNFIREVTIHSNFSHPSIINFIGYSPLNFFNSRLRHSPLMMMEFADRGSLHDIIEKVKYDGQKNELNDTTKLIIIYGIASSMSYIHSQGILHRDLTAKNIVFDTNLNPKVTDFGISKKIEDIDFNEGYQGTASYMAPEIWDGYKYTKSGDVYSFGILLYELMTNEFVFDNLSPANICYKIVINKIRPNVDKKNIGESYKQLIKKCWSEDINERPSFDQIMELLKTNKGFYTKKVDLKKFQEYVSSIDRK